jgi:site-specific recombinase XerD
MEPLGSYMNGYAEYLSSIGYGHLTLKYKISQVYKLNQWLNEQEKVLSTLQSSDLSKFISEIKSSSIRHSRIERAIDQFIKYLIKIMVIEKEDIMPKQKNCEWSQLIDGFEKYLREERRLSLTSIQRCLSPVQVLLEELYQKEKLMNLEKLTPEYIRNYYNSNVSPKTPFSRVTILVRSIRSFLKYLYLTSQLETDLTGCLLHMTQCKPSKQPESLPPEIIDSLLNSDCLRGSKMGIRNKAILLLLARLGLRAKEIIDLKLEDIDWANGSILISGKGGKGDKLPLPYDVGKAMSEYLRKVRPPKVSSRSFFLCMNAPIRKMARSASISSIVMKALKQSDILIKSGSSHLFRHSLACTLLKEGSNLIEIGQILRHQHPDTTAIYAKVDIDTLSELSKSWPERDSK